LSYIGKTPTPAPLTSSDITDSIISLPKLTNGTDGNLISYDASGNPVAVATGTDGQVLTSTGAGSPPVFETPASATNTPAFFAKLGSHQTISDATSTKITFNTEVYDSGSVYDNSTNYRFTPGVAGKYYVFAGLSLYGTAAFSVMDSYLDLYKNGSVYAREHHYEHDGSPNGSASFYMGRILDLDDDDYIEFFNFTDVTSGSPQIQGGTGTSNATYFGAYKIII
tara:strand:+ start:17 stop:688 length:672 start_codon:yes stop_codon:yes gene_type:complete